MWVCWFLLWKRTKREKRKEERRSARKSVVTKPESFEIPNSWCSSGLVCWTLTWIMQIALLLQHWEYSFVCLFVWPMDVQLLQHLLHWIALHLCQKSVRLLHVCLFLGSLICSIDLCVCDFNLSFLQCNWPIWKMGLGIPPLLLPGC